MQKIQTQETLSALKSGEILMTRKVDQIQFYALVNDRIRVQNANSRYTLSIEEWQTLFSDEDFWNEKLDAFEAENNCTIKVEIQGWTDYATNIYTGLLSAEGPDVVYVTEYYDIITSELIVPLDAYLTEEDYDLYLYLTQGAYNSNGELTGDKLTTFTIDNLGYGYIAMCANNVCVDGDPASDASKNLRKGFATLFAVYRDTVVNSYYGETASIIQYPISNTSWAAPRPADEGYETAFSVDVDGNPIYTDDMTEQERYDAALQAAIGFFKAAGLNWDEASGKFVA